jgi:hypothetical protein
MDIKVVAAGSVGTINMNGRFDFSAHRVFKDAYDQFLPQKAITTIEDVFTQLCPAGKFSAADAGQKRIQAKIFGGADLKASGLFYSDGEKSVAFVRSWLNRRHIPVVAENVGGTQRREIVLLPPKGVVYCRTLALDDNFLYEEISKLSSVKEEPNKIELLLWMPSFICNPLPFKKGICPILIAKVIVLAEKLYLLPIYFHKCIGRSAYCF